MNKKNAFRIILPLAAAAVAVVFFAYMFLPARESPPPMPAPPPEETARAAPRGESAPPPDESEASPDKSEASRNKNDPPRAESEPPRDAAAFRIGIVTGSTSQSYGEFLGAREIARLYGDAEDGGMVRHVTYPENFMAEMETTIARIKDLADDPLMKVIVINQGVPGTAEAVHEVKERRPDIICLVGESHEDVDDIASVADLAVFGDFISRGYLIPRSAKELGADTLVHISFPRHMMLESVIRRRAIMERACADLGLGFAFENAQDPLSSGGVDGARKFIEDAFPSWIERYGKNAAFFCTNNAHTEPLIRQIAKHGGYFVEANIASPLLGYPGAFGVGIGVDTLGENRDWPALLKKIEDAVVASGAGGRMGTWAYPYAFCGTAGMAEFGRLAVLGQAEITDRDALMECFGKFSHGAAWNDTCYTDARTGRQIKNCVLVYQDTYVFGRGYMGTTEVEIPKKYLMIGAEKDKDLGAPLRTLQGDTSPREERRDTP
jgi:hypothetical protein